MADIVSLDEARKGRVAQLAQRVAGRSDKKTIIQALLRDIANNLGFDWRRRNGNVQIWPFMELICLPIQGLSC